ncbi:lipopolysaccharide biosynthesis protein [Butyrivibrio sp. INlla21]|uniref:lipopolysaccharide biosynthesis protein n=1 Tax=Butyrivibrio sp. INlla21 TaxID=1520811 RepID=UPI0008EAA17D|nr:hypothetical protein [Butyrivibrio sp. INlla21]SFU89954.1 hypothetical protein SAMN02910342_02291 [Butyrivibrio sp. INlla21]
MSGFFSKNKLGFLKKFSKDFVFSVLALVIYNGALQLFIYPGMESAMGKKPFGIVLFLISVVSIMGAGFGTAASYSRMMAKKARTQENGDYNIFLLIVTVICIPVTYAALYVKNILKVEVFIPVLILMVLTVYRYYADVQYRMDIRFRDYFLFFTAVTAGYVIGLFVYPYLGSWTWVLILGEMFGLVFTYFSGRIFKSPYFKLSDSFRANMKSVWFISLSNLLGALILHSDRLLISLTVGEEEVTIFYTASVIGKIVALLTTPLNGIFISYLTNYKIKLTRKIFSVVTGAALIITFIGTFACMFVSDIFVKIKYPDVYADAAKLFLTANLGQLLYFISGSLMVVILPFTGEKFQLYINGVYVALFAVIVIPAAIMFGLSGVALGLVLVNILRFAIVYVIGMIGVKKTEE